MLNDNVVKTGCNKSQNRQTKIGDISCNSLPLKTSGALTQTTPMTRELRVFTRFKLFGSACGTIAFQLLPSQTFHFLEFYLNLVVFIHGTKPHTNTAQCTAAAYKMTAIITTGV